MAKTVMLYREGSEASPSSSTPSNDETSGKTLLTTLKMSDTPRDTSVSHLHARRYAHPLGAIWQESAQCLLEQQDTMNCSDGNADEVPEICKTMD